MAEPTAPKGALLPRHFGHGPLAQRLAHEVFDSLLPAGERRSELHPKTTGRLGPALVVGVFGEWGAGKSYLLSEVGDEIKLLREQRAKALAQQHPPDTETGEPPTEITVLVEFNAWRFEREPHLLIPMLKVAEQAMRDEVERAVPPGTKRREWLADHVALLGALIEGVYASGGRQALQMWLDAQGASLKLPEPSKEDKPPKSSLWEKLGLKKKALATPRQINTPIPALESLYFNFFEYLRGITGRNPSFLKNVQQRLTQGGLGPGIAALHRLEQAGRWLTTGQVREPTRLHVNLVFLVDDLDRCLPEKAIEVLEAVKLFLDVEGCAFVLALDEEVVERGIAHRYQAYTSAAQGQTPITGAEYLEKLIHLPIRLPRPHGGEAQQYLADHWPLLYAKEPLAPAPYEPNDLAQLVATLSPPVPRKLQRLTSLVLLNESLAGQLMTKDRAAMTAVEQVRWLVLMCALQLFAPSLFRYLRVHGADLLLELVHWRKDMRLKDLALLSKQLREETLAVAEPYKLREAYAREGLPERIQAVLSNRSGFSLLTWLEQLQQQQERSAPDGITLQRMLALAVAEPAPVLAEVLTPVKPTENSQSAQAQDESAPVQSLGLGEDEPETSIALVREPASSANKGSHTPRWTLGPDSPNLRARLENEFALWEPLMVGDPEFVEKALIREGAALAGKFLPLSLVDRLAQRARESSDFWLAKPLSASSRLVGLLNPLLTQGDALKLSAVDLENITVFDRPSWGRVARSKRLSDGALVHWALAPWRAPDGTVIELGLAEPSLGAVAQALISPRAWVAHPVQGDMPGGTWALGADGEYGLYLDLTVNGITQRLRWMEPGSFLMGSPEGQGRSDERPQHQVTFSQGFWLADTACTQALWRAVMGDNPSAFQSAEGAYERPVENVSFDDVQAFSDKLGEWLPVGWHLGLPTEAEWEYACRAGTQTAYWWGDDPDDEQVNWHQQQKGTTSVTHYPPNPWGLHDVHGNVWEWCVDDRRAYTGQAKTDPVGDTEGNTRGVRGGSWFGHPVRARSAARGGGHRGNSAHSRGFRFALRSSSPGAEPNRRAAEPA